MTPPKFQIAISNQQSEHRVSVRQLRKAIREVLCGEELHAASISLAIVDDQTIHRLNQRFLKHDYPTDVLSFVLDRDGHSLDGEIIVSADTAASACGEYGWTVQEELTLYVIHGTLHLIGYDDHTAQDRKRMRAKETEYLRRLSISPPKNGS
jgi:probable rRNA maturation factor